MLPVGNLINQVFWNVLNWDVYNQRFSASIPVDRVTGANQTQIGYWSDSQLWQTIAWSRFAYERNPIVKGILHILIDHIGKPTVTWLGKRKYVERVTKLWERFTTVNCLGESGYLSHSEIAQDREKEIRVRWLRDGEVFLRFFVVEDGYPLRLRFIEPEQVRTPPLAQDERFSHTWGIVTEKDDNEHIVGYWAFYPQLGEWEYIPRRYIVYARRNADRNIKRGLPEIANLELDFSYIWSLLRSVTVTSKAQASIAWIEKFPGALAEQILNASLPLRSPDTNLYGPMQPGQPNQSPSFYGIDPNAKNLEAGTILATNAGKEYEPGPTSDPGKYLEACSTLLHLFSLQWCLPDWITKGPEAYASALVNGSPFARRIESLQEDYAAIYGQLAMTFLRLMVRIGRLPKQVLRYVRPSVKLPKVIVADEQKQVDLLQRELEAGLLSEIEYLQVRGRNPKKILAQRKQWKRLLQEYGLEDEQGQTQQAGESSRSEEPHPPGSRILSESVSEDTCPKRDFHVFDTQTKQCTTVTRCSTWSPETSDRYQQKPECEKRTTEVSQDAVKKWNETREVAKSLWERIKQQVEEKRQKIAALQSQSTGRKLANDIAQETTAIGSLGTKALITLQLTSLLEKALNVNCSHREKNRVALTTVVQSLGKLIYGQDFKVAEDDVEIGEQVKKIIQDVYEIDSDEKVSKLGSKLVGSLVENIKQAISEHQKKGKVEANPDSPVAKVLGPHNFAGDADYFGKILALNAITNKPDVEDIAARDTLISPLLKRLVNRAPYEAAANQLIDDDMKQFLFDNLVNVGEPLYGYIVANIDELTKADANTEKGKQTIEQFIESVLTKAPNLYRSTSSSRAKRQKCIDALKEIVHQDSAKAKQLAIALVQRCLLAYGTADIARRVHEEKWASYTRGVLATNAEFPVVDLTAVHLEDGTLTINPISLKMHLSSSSDSFKKVADEATRFVTEKMQNPQWQAAVQSAIQRILGKIPKDAKAEEVVKRLTKVVKRSYRKQCSQHVNWNNSKVAQKCFNSEMVRMSLLAIAQQLRSPNGEKVLEAIRDPQSVTVQPFSIVRLRGDKIEWKRDYTGGLTQQIKIKGTRDDAIKEAWNQWITAPGSVSKSQSGTGNATPAQGNPVSHQNATQGNNATR